MAHLTIDELAAGAGTTTRSIRSLQTLGVLPHPDLRGRTGVYGWRHQQRLQNVLRLQSLGFSLPSLAFLFAAHERGESLGDVLGLAGNEVIHGTDTGAETGTDHGVDAGPDDAELYGFADLQPSRRRDRAERPLLAVVPTTVWSETEAS